MARTKEHLYSALHTQQEGVCALCGKELNEEAAFNNIDRYVTRGGAYSLENCRLVHFECDLLQEGIAVQPRWPKLRSAFQQRMLWMRTRMKLNQTLEIGVRKSPFVGSVSEGEFVLMVARATEHEKHFDKLVSKELTKTGHPLVETMRSIKGTGDVTIGLLLSMVDIKKARYPSSLWQYFGIGVPSKDRYTKGVKGGGSKMHRAVLRQWAESQVRLRTSYRNHEYDERRSKTTGEDKWNSDAHRHADACRHMTKLFLSHFWQTYRELEGLPLERPYILNQNGHTHYISPQERGWPVVLPKKSPNL
jgi:hypothetical protein